MRIVMSFRLFLFSGLLLLPGLAFSQMGDGPTVERCADLLKPFDLAKIPSMKAIYFAGICEKVSPSTSFTVVDSIVRFANKAFERRGWNAQFMEERLKIARRYSVRSEYTVTREGKDLEITGSVGITHAEYRAGVEQVQDLPMEFTHHWALERPLDSKGAGAIIEARTYAILESESITDPYSALWEGMNESVSAITKRYPELADREIVYTYGDETSIRMYRRLGFRVSEKYDPVVHDGVEWRVLVISPNELLRNFLGDRRALFNVGGLSGPQEFMTRDGLKLIAQYSVQMRGKYVEAALLAEDLVVQPGFVAKKGGLALFYSSGKPSMVSPLVENSKLGKAIYPDTSWGVRWDHDGNMDFKLREASEFEDGKYRVAAGSRVLVSHDLRLLEANELAEDAVISGTPWVAAAGSELVIPHRPGSLDGFRFVAARKAEILPNRIASRGSVVVIDYWPNGKISSVSISKTGKSFVHNGIVIPVGTSVRLDSEGKLLPMNPRKRGPDKKRTGSDSN